LLSLRVRFMLVDANFLHEVNCPINICFQFDLNDLYGLTYFLI
jgi:hypothetical protein